MTRLYLVAAVVTLLLMGCGQTGVECGGHAPAGYSALTLAELGADPGAWADERIAVSGQAVVESTGCTQQLCDCCRQCAATLKVTDGVNVLRLESISCSHDLCGGDCLLSVGASAIREGDLMAVHGTLTLTDDRGPREFVLVVDGACGSGAVAEDVVVDETDVPEPDVFEPPDVVEPTVDIAPDTTTGTTEVSTPAPAVARPQPHPEPASGPLITHPDDEAAFLFADGEPPVFEVTVNPADLADIDANPLDEVYIPATVVFNGVTHEPVGLRYKGSVGSLTSCFDWLGGVNCEKLSMKLDFAEYEPDRRFFGLKKLNFQAFDKDSSKLHERLSYHVFRMAGVAAPRSAHAWLIVNGQPRGLFGLTEQVDGRLTRSRFPDGGKGNLYKEVWPRHIAAQPYLDALKTNEDEDPDVGPMALFAKSLAYGGEATRMDTVELWTDTEALFRYLAVDRAIGAWDGVTQWYCIGSEARGDNDCVNHNYYWYQEENLGRLWLIPWDMDHSYEFPNPLTFEGEGAEWTDVTDCEPTEIFFGFYGMAATCDPLLGALIGPGWPRFVAAAEDLLAAPWFARDVIEARIDTWASLIASSVAADVHGPSMDAFNGGLAELKADAWALRVELEVLIGAREQP